MRVEGILGRHAPAHDSVQESLALAGIEAENLQGAEAFPGITMWPRKRLASRSLVAVTGMPDQD